MEHTEVKLNMFTNLIEITHIWCCIFDGLRASYLMMNQNNQIRVKMKNL